MNKRTRKVKLYCLFSTISDAFPVVCQICIATGDSDESPQVIVPRGYSNTARNAFSCFRFWDVFNDRI